MKIDDFNWDKFISDLSPYLAVAEQKEFYQFADVIPTVPLSSKKISKIGNDNYFTQYCAKPSIRLIQLDRSYGVYFLDVLLKDENGEGYYFMSMKYSDDGTPHPESWTTHYYNQIYELKDFSSGFVRNSNYWRGVSAIKVIIDFSQISTQGFLNWATNPFTQ